MSKPLCKDVMTSPVQTCRETDTARQCAAMMREHDIGFVPIVDGEKRAIGVVTDRDLATRLVAQDKAASTSLKDVMTSKQLMTCRPDEELRRAEDYMVETGRSRILVTDDRGCPRGVISLTEIAGAEERRRTGEILQGMKEGTATRRI